MSRYNYYKPNAGIGNLMTQKPYNKPTYNGVGGSVWNSRNESKPDFTEDIKLDNYSFGLGDPENFSSTAVEQTSTSSALISTSTALATIDNNRQVSVPAKPDRQPDHMRKLFIGGVPYSVTDDKLKGYFEKYGQVVHSTIIRDRFTNKSRGFGFVTYADIDMVDLAQKSRPHTMDGKELKTQRALPKREANNPEISSQSKQIVLFGLQEDTEESVIVQYFAQFGKVDQIRRPVDQRTGKKKSHAFIYFDDMDVVDGIVLRHHHNINGCKAEAKKSVPRRVLLQLKEYRRLSGGRSRMYNPWEYGNRPLQFGSGYGRNEGGGALRIRGGYGQRAYGPYGGYGQRNDGPYGGYGQRNDGPYGGYGQRNGGGYGQGNGAYGGYGQGNDGGYGGGYPGRPWMSRQAHDMPYRGSYGASEPTFRGPSWHNQPSRDYDRYRNTPWQQGRRGGGGGGDSSSRLHEYLKRKWGGVASAGPRPGTRNGGSGGGGYERRESDPYVGAYEEREPEPYGYSTVAETPGYEVTTSIMTQTITHQYGGASSYYPERYASQNYGDYDSSHNNTGRTWGSSSNYYNDHYKL